MLKSSLNPFKPKFFKKCTLALDIILYFKLLHSEFKQLFPC